MATTKPTNSETPEAQAVRAYLTYLNSPDQLVDEDAVSALEAQAVETTDILERAQILANIRKAKALDEDTFKAGFIASAKEWAESSGIPWQVLNQDLKVPLAVLSSAGFEVPTSPLAPTRGRPKGSSNSTGQRRTRTSPVIIAEGAMAMTEPFTVKDIVERVGGSTLTVTQTIKKLVADGKLTTAGNKSGGRGKPAVLYQRA